MASVALSAFQRQQEKSASAGIMKSSDFDKIFEICYASCSFESAKDI